MKIKKNTSMNINQNIVSNIRCTGLIVVFIILFVRKKIIVPTLSPIIILTTLFLTNFINLTPHLNKIVFITTNQTKATYINEVNFILCF